MALHCRRGWRDHLRRPARSTTLGFRLGRPGRGRRKRPCLGAKPGHWRLRRRFRERRRRRRRLLLQRHHRGTRKVRGRCRRRVDRSLQPRGFRLRLWWSLPPWLAACDDASAGAAGVAALAAAWTGTLLRAPSSSLSPPRAADNEKSCVAGGGGGAGAGGATTAASPGDTLGIARPAASLSIFRTSSLKLMPKGVPWALQASI